MFSDLASPAEAPSHTMEHARDFAQAGNRYPLFGIMPYAQDETEERQEEAPARASAGWRPGHQLVFTSVPGAPAPASSTSTARPTVAKPTLGSPPGLDSTTPPAHIRHLSRASRVAAWRSLGLWKQIQHETVAVGPRNHC